MSDHQRYKFLDRRIFANTLTQGIRPEILNLRLSWLHDEADPDKHNAYKHIWAQILDNFKHMLNIPQPIYIARVKRGQFQSFPELLGRFIKKVAQTKHMVTG